MASDEMAMATMECEFMGEWNTVATAAALESFISDCGYMEVEEEKDRAHAALLERRKKQRDIKRRSRARHKKGIEEMREQVRILEERYQDLLRPSKHSQLQPATNPHTEKLWQKYKGATNEADILRAQINEMKQKMQAFDRFHATLASSLSDYQLPTAPEKLPEESNSFELLTKEECYRIIRESYLEIFHPQWRGERISSGACVLGWSEERYVDGTTLQFSLSKSFAYVSPQYLMDMTWAIVTTVEHMRTVQRSTLGLKVLQVISKDIIVTQRRVLHRILNTVSCVNMLMFRLQTDNGYLVAYRTIRHPGEKNEQEYTKADFEIDENHDDNQIDQQDNLSNTANTKPKKKLKWVDTLQWFIFEERPIVTVDNGNVYKSTECKVTYGGKLDNQDIAYAGFFLVEVLAMIVRWDQAVASSQLLFFDDE